MIYMMYMSYIYDIYDVYDAYVMVYIPAHKLWAVVRVYVRILV